MTASKIIDNLLDLQKRYSSVFRGITTQERYDGLVETGILKDFTYDSKQIREPLLEHVGHIPVIAAYLHPLIEHSSKIDLGRTLVMLSIHDFGETIVGDVFAFNKTEKNNADELVAIKEHLHPSQLHWFEEFEARESFDSKFAKAVDSMSPILHEMLLPKVTVERFSHFNFNPEKVEAKKRKDFSWDGVLNEMFDELLNRYHQMIKDFS